MNTTDLVKQLRQLPLEAKKQLIATMEKLPPERRREILALATEKAKRFARTRKGQWMLFGTIVGIVVEEVPLAGRALNWPLWLALVGLARGTLDDFEFESV